MSYQGKKGSGNVSTNPFARNVQITQVTSQNSAPKGASTGGRRGGNIFAKGGPQSSAQQNKSYNTNMSQQNNGRSGNIFATSQQQSMHSSEISMDFDNMSNSNTNTQRHSGWNGQQKGQSNLFKQNAPPNQPRRHNNNPFSNSNQQHPTQANSFSSQQPTVSQSQRNPFSSQQPSVSQPQRNPFSSQQPSVSQPQRNHFSSQQPSVSHVTQHAISAVNAAAALAPSKVEEIDLGLGAGVPDSGTTIPITASAASFSGVSSAEETLNGDGGMAVKSLLQALLASSPAAQIPEEAPAQSPYELMNSGEIVAGRVPAVPPPKCVGSGGRSSVPQQANSSSGYSSAFGRLQ